MGTVRTAAAHSRLPAYPEDVVDGVASVEALADRFARHAGHLQDDGSIEETGVGVAADD